MLSGRISNATIHGVVTDDANRDYTVVTGANKQVSRFSAGVPSNPSLEVETDCDTVTRVVDADKPDQAFSSAYDDGDIEVSGVGLVNTIIVEVLKVGYTIGQALGLL